MNRIGKKTKTHLVLGLAVLLSIIHTWHPITLSPTNSGDRTMFMFVILFFAFLAKNGLLYSCTLFCELLRFFFKNLINYLNKNYLYHFNFIQKKYGYN